MARKPKPDAEIHPQAVVLAEVLRAGLAVGWTPDDLPSPAEGIDEPGALFHVIAPDGRRYRVRVVPQGR